MPSESDDLVAAFATAIWMLSLINAVQASISFGKATQRLPLTVTFAFGVDPPWALSTLGTTEVGGGRGLLELRDTIGVVDASELAGGSVVLGLGGPSATAVLSCRGQVHLATTSPANRAIAHVQDLKQVG
mmetsp:Transcript_3278/g.7598  ORF Transcript_3278/g.7598 Transcript_3278/m.7598 type:complete len:130 (-) Transcript_3278:36-425(-)